MSDSERWITGMLRDARLWTRRDGPWRDAGGRAAAAANDSPVASGAVIGHHLSRSAGPPEDPAPFMLDGRRMATRPTQLKNQRERALAARRKEKALKRQEAQANRARAPRQQGDEDPDIAGIVPGPQPPQYDDFLPPDPES